MHKSASLGWRAGFMLTPVTFAECTRLDAAGGANYFILILFAAFLGIALWVIRQQSFLGKNFFVTANLALLVWLFAALMELFSATTGCKVFWSTLAFPGIGLLSVSWFLFIYRFIRNESDRVLPWQWVLLVVVPTLGTTASVSTPWHGLFYGLDTAPANGFSGSPVVYDHEVLFYANAALLYVFITASVIMLGVAVMRSAGRARLMFVTLFLMSTVPMLANFSYITLGVNIAGFDPTPFVFSFLLLTVSWLASLTNLFQVSSIANDMIFDNLDNAVVVVARQGQIIAANSSAQKVLSFTFTQNLTVRDVPALSDLMAQTIFDTPHVHAVETAIGIKDFEVSFKPVFGIHKQVTGFTLVFFEVTSRIEAQHALSSALRITDFRLDAALQQNRQISDEVMKDVLTGLLNRRSLPVAFDAMTASHAVPIFVVIIDIDYFKAINDRLGHAVGDKVLTEVGTCLRAAFRTDDKVFRVGGEEFLILSASIDIKVLHARITNLQQSVAEAGKILLPADMPLTFSAGIGGWPEDGNNMADLFDIVDKRLYRAKKTGRNRTVGPLESLTIAQSINRTVVSLVGVR